MSFDAFVESLFGETEPLWFDSKSHFMSDSDDVAEPRYIGLRAADDMFPLAELEEYEEEHPDRFRWRLEDHESWSVRESKFWSICTVKHDYYRHSKLWGVLNDLFLREDQERRVRVTFDGDRETGCGLATEEI